MALHKPGLRMTKARDVQQHNVIRSARRDPTPAQSSHGTSLIYSVSLRLELLIASPFQKTL